MLQRRNVGVMHRSLHVERRVIAEVSLVPVTPTHRPSTALRPPGSPPCARPPPIASTARRPRIDRCGCDVACPSSRLSAEAPVHPSDAATSDASIPSQRIPGAPRRLRSRRVDVVEVVRFKCPAICGAVQRPFTVPAKLMLPPNSMGSGAALIRGQQRLEVAPSSWYLPFSVSPTVVAPSDPRSIPAACAAS